jgi:ketosteroid isomerase-like protein
MSRESIDWVRRWVETYNAGGLDAVVDTHWHEAIELVDSVGLPDAGSYVGKEQLRARIESFFEFGWDGVFRVEELIDAGDEVAMVWRLLGKAPGSEVPIDASLAFAVRLDDGRLSRIRQYRTREEALEAVGLSE